MDLASTAVRQAISKEQKEKVVEGLLPLFEKSSVVVGLRYKGLTVKQMEEFRNQLPETAKLMVCKNTLVNLASQRVPGWVELEPATKGDNAWLFVEEDDIAKPITKQSGPLPLGVSGGVIEGQAFGHEMMKRLESMPTRKELMAKVAGLLKQVPMRVALAIKAVPSKLSRSVKALADAEEADRTKLLGDVFPLGVGKPAEGQ
ncbi:hypothetical protein QBZ16_003420 [Prototheca wickerhamii]|uniref:50S ribosomal protein L10 n=1 Tax=Prototheca wickerhamii TaxID=3111 RepID=A0AAD9IJX5_PROWI|nr:hypothetical protein QBZ16_003420 [Prototheca wickerhamii]